MKLVLGTHLTPAQQAEVKRAYIYRWTIENSNRERAYRGLNPPTLPPTTDEQWLADHAFYVTNTGQLSRRHNHCEPAFMAD